MSSSQKLRIAVEGCGHGTLDAIYASVQKSCEVKNWDGVDLLIICGDFQAVRTQRDLNVTAMPPKYRQMGDFHQYYYGKKTAPYLTVFIGGNHEASNHLFELYYGGWVAPNIYYLGATNVIRLGPLKIASMSGIWKGFDYNRPHYERLPYSDNDMRSIYHQRELDVRKLLSYRSQVDIGLSHDWPQGIEWLGDHQQLFRRKAFLLDDAKAGKLGSKAATWVMDRLRPAYWLSAHLHVKYTASKSYEVDRVVTDKQHENQTAQSHNNENNSGDHVNILKTHEATTGDTKSGPTESISAGVDNVQTPTDSDTGSSTPKNGPNPRAKAISAWGNFSSTVVESDAKAYEEELEAKRQDEEQHGKRTVVEYDFNETFKEVSVAHVDGAQSRQDPVVQKEFVPQIPQLDGPCFSSPKRRRQSSPLDDSGEPARSYNEARADIARQQPSTVTNPDAIDIDMSDSDDDASTEPILTKGNTSSHNPNDEHKKSSNLSSSLNPSNSFAITENFKALASHFEPPEGQNGIDESIDAEGQSKTLEQPIKHGDAEVSDDVRAQLAALSTTFAPEVKVEKTADLPFPSETITNKTTRFLALSKVEKGRDHDFLQLLEIDPLSTTGKTTDLDRPLKLEYDSEWLAILRVFASELTLGGTSYDKIPSHRGDTYYRERIIEEEKWVKDNIVAKSLTIIPDNFVVTVEPETSENGDVSSFSNMPREQTNPQTAKFCELIGIENMFDFSEEDRAARVAAGPSSGDDGDRRRGGGSYRGGGRGGGRGRGRGRGRGGRGRGRW